MKRRHLQILLGFIALVAFIVGYATSREQQKVNQRIETIRANVSVGDDIHFAKEKLENLGFTVTDVIHPTISKSSLSCVVKVNELNSIDGLEYATNTNLRPWRSGIKYHVVISAQTDGTIREIEAK